MARSGPSRRRAALLALVAALTPIAALARTPTPPAGQTLPDLQLPGAGQARFRNPAVAQGVASLKAGDAAKAGAAFSLALSGDPQNAYLHFLNGLAYHLLALQGDDSQRDLAETGYRQALQFDPNAWWAAYGLGLLHAERSDYAAAQDDFAQVLLIDRDNAGALQGLAVASYYLGDLRMAGAAVGRALAARPDDPATLRCAALIAAARGDGAAARTFAVRYDALEPQAYRRAFVDRRMADWRLFHLALATPSAPAMPPAPPAAPSVAPPAPPANPHIGKQVLVDVVYIRSQTDSAQDYGVNLLRGLQLQYGYSNTHAHTTLYPFQQAQEAQPPAGAAPPVAPFPHSILQTVAIPAITYSLNIFNSQTAHNEVVARPTLIAQEGSPSSFFSGKELTIALAGQYGGNLNNLEVGVSLTVTPILVEADRVTLDVAVKRTGLDDNLAGTFQQAVQTTNNRVSATVTLGYDQTLVLTGLTDRETSSATDRTPLLGEIPGLQYLFKQKAVSDSSRSVLIMLTPHRSGMADPAALGGPSPNVAALQRDWTRGDPPGFSARPALPDIFQTALQASQMARELRAGDLALDEWSRPDTLQKAIRQDLEFLYF